MLGQISLLLSSFIPFIPSPNVTPPPSVIMLLCSLCPFFVALSVAFLGFAHHFNCICGLGLWISFCAFLLCTQHYVFFGGGLGGFCFLVFGFFQYSTNYTLLRPSTMLSKIGKILISLDHIKIEIPFNFTS